MRRRFQGFVTRKVKPREVGDVRRMFAQQDRSQVGSQALGPLGG
jgi:hypothetical protein